MPISLLLLLPALIFPSQALAGGASLSIFPSAGTFYVGETIKTSVYLDSGGYLVNAAEAVLTFPAENLRVASLSKGSSVFPFWAIEPSFDNAKGEIAFAGGTTGYFSGSRGEVLSIIFHVKKSGTAALNFGSARVLLADGVGTNVFGQAAGANWTLAPSTPISAPPAAAPPKAPAVISSTHPNQDGWYSNSNPHFSWNLTPDITAVRVLFDKHPDSVPAILYSPPIGERTLGGIEDGIWYFHIQMRNSAGWSPAAHFRVQIDTKPPERLVVQFPDGRETGVTRPRISFSAVDELSGIARYEVKIDGGEWLPAEHVLPELSTGEHEIAARAVDAAGNAVETSEKVFILAPKLDLVKIISFAVNLLLLIAVIYLIVTRPRKRA